MLNQSDKERVRVVLVGARNPNNIGAAARAMQDFGFRDLRLVNDYRVPFEGARSAVGAAELLSSAIESDSVAEAVGDCSLVIGTTAVGERGVEHRLLGLVEAAKEMVGELQRPTSNPEPRIALLFGSEKTGLTNDELSHCDWLLTIPMQEVENARHLSMNLGQSVAVCLWELVRAEGAIEPNEELGAEAAEVERITTLLREAMEATEYTRRFPANCDETDVRRLVKRMQLSQQDATAWMGIWRQVLWKLRKQSS